MKAEEAREIAENKNTDGIEDILSLIKEAAEANKFYITIDLPYNGNEFKVSKLRRLGYKVDVEDHIDRMDVSW